MLRGYPVSAGCGYILKSTIAEVTEQEPPLVESIGGIRVNVPIHQKQIRPRVIVIIDECDTPAEETSYRPESGLAGHFSETAVAIIPVNVRRVIDEVSLRQVDSPVAVVVSRGGTHAGLFTAVFAQGHPRFHAGIGERTVLIIAVENAGLRVHRHVEVGPTVVVVVEGSNRQRVARSWRGDFGYFRNIRKFHTAGLRIVPPQFIDAAF